MATNTKSGEIEANPAPKYEDHDGPQRVGADTGTAYPVDGPAPKESVTADEPGSEPVVKKVAKAKS